MIPPKKSLGQHFLTNPRYCSQILELAEITHSDTVLEIGPGTGFLTSYLISNADRVTALEFDRDMVSMLEEKFTNEIRCIPPRLRIVQSNVLSADWRELLFQLRESRDSGNDNQAQFLPKIAGNLPYNISTRILEYSTHYKDWFQSFTFMCQKEVAARILASPGSPDYGYFTLLMEFNFHRKSGFDVPPGAFTPAPKVISHVMQLRPRFIDTACRATFVRIIKTAFRQRRKTIYNNLKPLFQDPKELSRVLNDSGIPEKTRPQQISLEQFLTVSDTCCRVVSFKA